MDKTMYTVYHSAHFVYVSIEKQPLRLHYDKIIVVPMMIYVL